MGNRGRQYIKNHFSWIVLEKYYLTFYDWIINDGPIPDFVDTL